MTIYMPTAARTAKELPMTDAERQARVELAACYRIFDMLGWTELIFNHITLRVPGSEPRFLINPFGLHYREITASSLVLIDLEGNVLRESKWPVNRAGFVIHSAIHGAAALAGGEINRLSPQVIERMLGESGPGEARTNQDVFAAMLRLLDARDPSYRD